MAASGTPGGWGAEARTRTTARRRRRATGEWMLEVAESLAREWPGGRFGRETGGRFRPFSMGWAALVGLFENVRCLANAWPQALQDRSNDGEARPPRTWRPSSPGRWLGWDSSFSREGTSAQPLGKATNDGRPASQPASSRYTCCQLPPRRG